MAIPSIEKIQDIILDRRRVYGLDVDSQIRRAANQMTARALLEMLGTVDDEAPDFALRVSRLLSWWPREELSGVIGFKTDESSTGVAEQNEDPNPTQPIDVYLRLVFENADAAYYQFHVFPNLDADYVLGYTRKRTGAVQHLHIHLSNTESLQTFMDECRGNPHFIRVEESTAEEFDRAPSNGV